MKVFLFYLLFLFFKLRTHSTDLESMTSPSIPLLWEEEISSYISLACEQAVLLTPIASVWFVRLIDNSNNNICNQTILLTLIASAK